MKQEKRVRVLRTVIAGSWQKVKCYATGTLCLLALCLAACSNEDEEGGGMAGYGKTANEVPPVANAGIKFPVTTVYHNSGVAFAFSYKNGRMTSSMNSNKEPVKFYSNPLTIKIITHPYSDGGNVSTETEEYKNIRVNSNGFITSCVILYTDVDEDEVYTEQYDVTVAYDGEGHMVLEKAKYKDSYGDGGQISATYTWKDGNLMKLSSVETWTDEGEEETDRYEEEYTYEENKYPNPGVWHFRGSGIVRMGACFDESFLYAGLLGKPTKNIPISCKESQYYDNEFIDYTTEGVNYNNDGSISDIRYGSIRTYYSGYTGNYTSGSVSFDYDTDWNDDYDQLSPNYNRQKKSIASGSRHVRKGHSLRKRVMERNAQRNNTH